MNVEGVISAVAAGFGIVSLLVGALVFVSGSYNKARVQALRDDNDDLRSRVADLEHEESRLKGDMEHLKEENATLRELVLQRAKVDDVIGKIERHHKAAVEHWENIVRMLSRIDVRVGRGSHE